MSVRVLIAEDEWLIAATLRSLIESHGYQVVGTAKTGTEALSLCHAEHPDVVVMDVQMPEMDGLAATRALMEDSPTCVVISTGKSQLEQLAEQVGAMNYIIKPLLWNQIPTVVESSRQRFEQFMTVRQEAKSFQEALDGWLMVKHGIQLLVEEQALSEAEAFQCIRQEAALMCCSLRTAAERLAQRAKRPKIA